MALLPSFHFWAEKRAQRGAQTCLKAGPWQSGDQQPGFLTASPECPQSDAPPAARDLLK